jgi:stage V sporulation protein B
MGLGVKLSYGYLVAYGLKSHYSTILSIMAGVAIYGLLLLLLKEIDKDMLKKIKG